MNADGGRRCLTAARVRSTFISREPKMGHAEYASKSLAVLMKLAAMLRIVPAMQFVLDKLAALLRGKGSDELLADEFLDEASCITRSAVVQRAVVLQPSSEHAIAVPKTDEPDREQLIRRRWLETGIKMWNSDHHGAGHAALNIQGQAELLPPKPGETLPEYDTLEFKIARSCVNGQEVDHIVCEGVVVEPPTRRAERLTTGAAVT